MPISSRTRTAPVPVGATANERFRTLCAKLAAACLALASIAPMLVPIQWWFGGADSLLVLAHLGPGDVQSPLRDGLRTAGALVCAVPVLLGAWSFWQAHECLTGFARGEVFTTSAARHLRRLAMRVGTTALAAFAVVPALSAVLTWDNAIGARAIVVGDGVAHALVLLCAMVLWLLSGVLRQGQLLAEENAAFL
ncbi:MAG: DUF2975 domain-containing protein [Pseudomonadota bacterium]